MDLKFTDWYFKPRKWEEPVHRALRSERMALALSVVGRALTDIAFISASGKPYPKGQKIDFPQNYFVWDSSEKGLRNFDMMTRLNETFHTFFLLNGAIEISGKIAEGRHAEAAADAFWTAAINIPPVLANRFNRARVHKILRAIEIAKKRKVEAAVKTDASE